MQISNENKILSFIGLAKRAGKIVSGEEKVISSLKTTECALVILSEDASENTKKKISDKCSFYKKDLLIFSDRFSLGKYTKKDYAVVLSVTDEGFSGRIKQLSGILK